MMPARVIDILGYLSLAGSSDGLWGAKSGKQPLA
jgi:hypothetical protein